MPNKATDKNRYCLEYPSYLQSHTRQWVTSEGDLLRRNGTVYKVVQIVRPVIKGVKPRLVLEPLDFNEDEHDLPL
jgi:hypothetical protein